jgi:hypothetical protein
MDTPDKGRELFFLAQDARKQGHHAEAESYLREALLHSPGRESIRTNLCGAVIDQGKHAEALTLCEELVRDFPASAVGWHRLSICQFATGLTTESLVSIRRSIELTPDNIDALEHRVAILLRRDDTEAALDACRDALRLLPQHASLHTALGVASVARREFTQAREAHERALQLAPEHPDKRWNLALTQLMLGDLASGWENLEARWTGSDAIRVSDLYAGTAPRWTGDVPLHGQKILVWAEQGLGDVIQFCRYIPYLVQAGAQVILQVPRALLTLMRHSLPSSAIVVAKGEPLPAHDFHLPLLSLPRFVGDDPQHIPAPIRLSAPQFHREFWRNKTGECHKPKVGLMWQGNLSNLRGLHRSLELAELASLFTLPLEFCCVSNVLSAQDADWLRTHAPSVRSFTRDIKDFSDTAALIGQLDLLISIDTSIAHLGGSLDVPTWILLAHSADWRWQTAETQTPWYPRSRLFRQETPGEWSAPVQALRAALAERFPDTSSD